MLKRLLSTVLPLALTAAVAHAALRVPQVPVSGTALATFFASQGQTIDVNTQQLDLQTLSVPTGNYQVHAFGPDNGATFGAYNAAAVSPPLYQFLPGSSTTGWYSTFSFRTAPTRLVVTLFDNNSVTQGSTTYLAGPPDASAFGFYVLQAPGAGGLTFYTQDARNPGGTARILAYNATGPGSAGWAWFACETGAGPGGDYADYVALVQLAPAPVPVSQTKWGTLKARFR